MLDPDQPQWPQTLLAREMVEPTSAIDGMVERSIRPMYEHLTGLVRRLLPKGSTSLRVRDCIHSVIGQVLLFKHRMNLNFQPS